MKLLVVKFEEVIDTTPFPPGTPVIVSNLAAELTGIVMANVHMEEPPTLEGNYHIVPLPV